MIVQLLIAQALSMPNVGTGESSVTTADPAAIYWNPALISELNERELMLDANLLIGDVRYERDRRGSYQREDALEFRLPVPAALLDPSKTGRAPEVRANPVAPLPSLFTTYPLALPVGRLAFGLGLYAPYAAALEFDPLGAQRFQLQQALIATMHATLAASYRLNDVFSIGAGLTYVLGFAELSKVADFAGLPELGAGLANPPISQANDFGVNAPVGVRELSVMARDIHLRQMVAHAVTFNAGVTVRPLKALLLSLAYQHGTPLHFRGTFALNMNDDFFTRDLASQGLAFKPVVRGDATLAFSLPRSIHAGIAYSLRPTWSLHLNAAYTFWSAVQTFDVKVTSPNLAQPAIGLPDSARIALARAWRDTIALDLLTRMQILPPLWLWATAGYRSPATPDATIDVASPDGHRIVAGVGGTYSVARWLSLVGELKVHSLIPRTVTSSDYDLGNGTYRLTLVVIGLHARIRY